MIKEKILNFIRAYVEKESSAHRLALSVSIGTFIAFSPYHFFHTIMVFILAWLFGLNVLCTMAVTYAINNPWTMFFVYAADYGVGECFFKMFGVRSFLLNPSWMEFLNAPLRTHLGIEGFSFWAFFVGGNLLGLFFSAMLYPIIKNLCGRINRVPSAT